MAEVKAEVVKIDSINEHPNADRMELAMIGGYQVCVQKGVFKAGDLAVYVPVDSVLPDKLESLIFGPDSKVRLKNHRVKAIKLRGAMSQGMLLPYIKATSWARSVNGPRKCKWHEGCDVTADLGITKYQPPASGQPQSMRARAKRIYHPDFHKYTDINQLRRYWTAFKEGENVIVSEKIHGTNFRAGWVKFVPKTFLQKLKNIFGLNRKWEFVYGSHNVQLMDDGENVYKRVVDEHELPYKIPFGQVWYGEIFGDGIQKGYSYGFKDGKVDVAFFDVMDSEVGEYLDWDDMVSAVEQEGEQVVPWTIGEYNMIWMQSLAATEDPSLIDHITKPVEGFVVRSLRERKFYGGRLILKLLTNEYLLRKGNTDWH
jgi:RNA ligase (TIGR02306 family)